MATDRRDLANVEPFMQLLTEAAVEGVECTISNEMARSLSDFIASQSRELERLKAELEISWDDLPSAIDALDDVIPQGCQQLLRQCAKELRAMRAENERLQTAFDQAVFENNDWHKLADERSAEIVRLDRELRRPVVQSDEIAMALYELDAAVHASCIQDGDYSPVKVIRDALDQAQRQNEGLQTAVVQLEEVCRIKDQQIARLSSPPEERRDIQERQKRRWDAISRAAFDNISHTVSAQDIDVLIQDLRRYENSHGIVMGERDAALAKVGRLEAELSDRRMMTETWQKNFGQCTVMPLRERIERLEGAARRVVDEWDRDPQCRVDVPAIGKLRLELAAADGQQRYPDAMEDASHPDWDHSHPHWDQPSATGDGVEGE